ncbi:MAG: type II secretion system major pseudopilin GspG [Gammaproteobacteria bacterium]|nr:type II secretion system major pseudopilin GspG [Gammaproteobacteria bacterium]
MNNHQLLKKQQIGFTLIEIMVVVVILSILAGFIVPQLMDKPDIARAAKAEQDIRALETALDLYKLDNFQYPTTEQGLDALVNNPGAVAPNWKGNGYLKRLPKDPWGSDYQYLSPGGHGEVDIYSLGADRKLSGSGVSADIGNWEDS